VGVRDALAAALPRLGEIGLDVAEDEPDLSGADEAFETWRAFQSALGLGEEYDARGADMKEAVREEVERGRALDASRLIRATSLQATLAERALASSFGRYDYLACPVTQVDPFPVEQEYAVEVDGGPDGVLHRMDALQLAHQRARLPRHLDPRGLQRGRTAGRLAARRRSVRRALACSRLHLRSRGAAVSRVAFRPSRRSLLADGPLQHLRRRHVAIAVADVERSCAFYARVLGFERLIPEWTNRWSWGTNAMGLAIFDHELHPSSTPDGTESPSIRIMHIAFRVDRAGLDEARRELAGEDFELRFSDHGISQSLYFRDPGRPPDRADDVRALIEPALLDLAQRRGRLAEPADAELALDAGGPLELNGLVGDDLEVVAPRIAEVEATRARVDDLEALAFHRRAHRGDVVDDEAEVALVVGGLPATLHQCDELVAHVDEGRTGRAAAQLECEQSPVQLQRGVQIADLESHMVHADQSGLRLHGAKARPAWRSGQTPAAIGCAP